MQFTCLRCRNSSFSISQDRAVSLHCLVCRTDYTADAVLAEKARQSPAKPRLQWIFK